jgi:hypothetical protein
MIKVYAFGCDAPGCGKWSDDYAAGPIVDWITAEQYARKDGWHITASHKGIKCPDHAPGVRRG